MPYCWTFRLSAFVAVLVNPVLIISLCINLSSSSLLLFSWDSFLGRKVKENRVRFFIKTHKHKLFSWKFFFPPMVQGIVHLPANYMPPALFTFHFVKGFTKLPRLASNCDSPASASPFSGITGVCPHACPLPMKSLHFYNFRWYVKCTMTGMILTK